MKNEEKFKTLEERKVAFKKFCNKYDCTNCPVPGNIVSALESYSRIWLRLQAEEEEKNMTNKDKYKTPEERGEGFSKFCKSHEDCLNCEIRKEASITRKSRNCKFAWLTLEAEDEDEENKIDKPVLTNEEKYKSVEEQTKAYKKFCKSFKSCFECPALRDNAPCELVWLTLKSYEEKHD